MPLPSIGTIEPSRPRKLSTIDREESLSSIVAREHLSIRLLSSHRAQRSNDNSGGFRNDDVVVLGKRWCKVMTPRRKEETP